MASFNQEFNGIIAGMKEQAASEREHFERTQGFGDDYGGVKWTFGLSVVSERPFIQASCPACKTKQWFEGLAPKHSCHGITVSCPPELIERLKKAQIKRGLRVSDGVAGFLDRILGKKEEPKPALNNF
jgi:hypothetical protein